jgi:putative ABC transport system substrate-binding protein
MAKVMTFVTATGKPSFGPYPEWGRAGLLMSYSTDPLEGYRNAGIYAAKIVKGAKPGDLPILQASKFVLVINQKTARSLGIAVPPTILALADEVIE